MDQCPRGYICINNFNLLGVVLIVLFCLYYFNKEATRKIYDNIKDLQNENEKIKNNMNDIDDKNKNKEEVVYYNRDRVAVQDHLYPPLKRNFHIDSNIQRGIPINIETRGPSESYQQIGMLYKDSINDENIKSGNNTDSNILPLYGKPTYRGSQQWLYYTNSDKFNSVKIPINYQGKDCTDDYGCREIYDGDSVSIPSYNGNFKVKIYKFDKPRYLPYVY